MTVYSISGHQSLSADTVRQVVDSFRSLFAKSPGPLVGVSSLAAGADQLFAEEILSAGGVLKVIVPSFNYENTFKGPDLYRYRNLLKRASQVEVIPFSNPGGEAYDAANRQVIEGSDKLIAVWDGSPSRGLGGTADAVAYAQKRGVPVEVVWPAGSARG